MSTVSNMSDHAVNELVRIGGTIFDRHVKLTPNDHKAIKEMREAGKSIKAIAKEFGVAWGTINYSLMDEENKKFANWARHFNHPQVGRKFDSDKQKERIAYKRALLEVREENS